MRAAAESGGGKCVDSEEAQGVAGGRGLEFFSAVGMTRSVSVR